MKTETKAPRLKESFQYFKRFLLLVKPYWGKIIKGLALGVVVGMIGMVSPLLTKLLVDQVYPAENVSLMHVIVASTLGISVGSMLIGIFQGYYNTVVNTHLSNSTSLMFFNHLQHLKIRFFDEHRVGEIMSRFGDVGGSLKTVNNLFQTVFANGIYLFIVPPFLFLLHWKLAIISLVSLPVTLIIITISGRIIRKYWKKSAEAFAELNAFQFESLSNIRLVKSLVLEKHVFTKTKNQMENAINIQLKAGILGQIMGFFSSLTSILNTTLFTWLGWTYILSKEMSLGDFLAFSSYIGYLYGPLSKFVNLFSDFQQSSISLNRMYEYLDSEVEKDPTLVYNETEPLKNILTGNIDIKDVSFSYTEEKKVLHNIDMLIEKGTVTTIVGPSGSGKTTLLRLILGMEALQEGSIRFDDKFMKQYSLDEIRKQISVVWQEFSIIKGTLWDNLVLGTENATENNVNEVVKICKLDELVESLPEKYETAVSEWGSTLSGGQRQRISIARTLLRNSPILILDEATSNIDITTETQLLKNLYEYMSGKTIISVTHRMTANHLADKIYILEAGKITSSGTHNELVNSSDVYRQMYFASTMGPKEINIKTIIK